METAGTALKTIIARFTEVKELFSQGMLTGTDEEGETIDINKIDTALKKVGISLKSFLSGEQGLDDILLELASKWNTLDIATQRYIATTAAGSRQQSRFLAMMSDYGRTMELVSAANNSAGASQNQYDKTLESLATSTQRLRDAWDEFVMGLANDKMLKGSIDALTKILEVINSITDACGELGGSLAKVMLLIGSLKAGKGIFTKITGKSGFSGKISNGQDGGKSLAKFDAEQQALNESIKLYDTYSRNIMIAVVASQAMVNQLDSAGYANTAFAKGLNFLGVAATGAAGALKVASIASQYFKASIALTAPILAVIGAAIAAIGYISVTAFKKAQEASTEFKLDKVEKQIDKINSNLDDTKNQAQELINDKAKLDELNTTLNNLTAGTANWKEALVQVNEQVMQLLDKYPQLQVVMGQNGALQITPESWDNVVQSQNQTAYNLQQQQYRKQEERNQLQLDLEYEKLNSTIFKQGIDLLNSSEYNKTQLNENDTNAFFVELAKRGITTFDSLSNSFNEIKDSYLSAKNFSESTMTDAEKSYIDGYLKLVINELQSNSELYTAYSSKVQGYQSNNEVLEFQSVKNSFLNNEATKNRTDIDALTNLMISSKDYATFAEKAVEQIEQLSASEKREQYVQKYSALGYKVQGSTIVDREGQKLELTKEDIDTELINQEINNLIQQYTQKITDFIDSSNLTPDIANALLSNEGNGINSELIKQYMLDGKVQTDKIIKDFGINFENSPITQENFNNLLQSNFEKGIDRINKDRTNLNKKMFNLISDNTKKQAINEQGATQVYTNLAKILQNIEEKGNSEEMRSILNSSISVFEGINNRQFASNIFAQYAGRSLVLDESGFKELSTFVQNINWNNPINAMKAIQQEAKNGSAATKEFAQGLLDMSNSAIGAGEQIKYLFSSIEYEEIQDKINEIIDTQDELTGSDVRDLADSYDILNTLLENTSLTAAGLAEILESIAKQELDLNSITDFLVAAASGIGSLDDNISDTLSKLSDYDFGEDENQVNDFVKQMADIAVKNLKAGNFNNEQLNNVADLMFGKGWDKNLSREERESKIIAGSKTLNDIAQTGNLSGFYELAYQGKNLAGESTGLTPEEQQKKYGMYISKDKYGVGTYGIEGYEGRSIEEIETFMTDILGTSELLGKLPVIDMKQQDSDMSKYLNELNYQKGIKSSYDTLKSISGFNTNTEENINSIAIDKTQIQAVADMYGKEYNEVFQDYASMAAQRGKELKETLFYDDKGQLKGVQDLVAEFKKVITPYGKVEQADSVLKKNYVAEESNGKSIIDYDSLIQDIRNSGIPTEVQQQVAFSTAKGMAQGMEDGKATIQTIGESGFPIEVEIDSNDTLESFQQKLKQADLKANIDLQAEANAEALKKVFTDETVNFQVNTDEVDTALQNIQEENPTVTTTFVVDRSAVDSMITYLNGLVVTPTVSPQVSGSSTSGTGSSKPRLANGIKNATSTFGAIVGDGDGPELIQTKDEAYIAGLNGPEYATIHKNDTVYTAEETRQIFKNRKHSKLPRFYHGYGQGVDITGGSSGGKGSGSSKAPKEEDKWENPYDKLYNLVRKIDEELRQRERIERRYEKLIEGIGASADKIVELSRDSLEQLERERMLQEDLVTSRRSQIEQYQKENSDLTGYGNVVQNERGESVLRINWDLINSVTDPDAGERIEKYISQLEEWFDSLNEAEEALWDIEDAVDEIKERGEDEYFDLEEAIKDALIQSYQEQIDELSNINNSINETNTDVLDAIQKSIDKQRQDRDNQRTEDDLAEKQRRLLYLQQDTSGANALEILRLQEEISQGQEDYTDTLIDQKISELQEQNDEAAKQREQQITLAQAQLDHYIETGRIWQEVYQLMEEGLNGTDGLIKGSRLEEILKNADNFSGLSAIGKQEWWNDFNNMIAQALAYLEVGRQLEDIGVTNQEITFTNSEGKVLTGKVDDKGNVIASDGKTYNNVFQGADGNYYAGENIKEPEKPIVEKPNNGGTISGGGNHGSSSGGSSGGGSSGGSSGGGGTITVIYGNGKQVTYSKNAPNLESIIAYWASQWDGIKARYKKGGLADFTGPAWLDGTKAKPEIVLNAQDSKNFIILKDVLSSVLNNGKSKQDENSGIISYDIDINVDKLENDYDVDQIANRIKTLIMNDARYRNNNIISLKR